MSDHKNNKQQKPKQQEKDSRVTIGSPKTTEQTPECVEPHMEPEKAVHVEEEKHAPTENTDPVNKEVEKEKTIVIKSPFPNNQGALSDDGFSDVTIGFADGREILRAHRLILNNSSKTMKELFHGHQVDADCIYDAEASRVQWETHSQDNETGRTALFQCIKFCYGADLCVNPMNAAATIDALFRLNLNCEQNTQGMIKQHMITVAGNDVESGSLMLRHCAEYEVSNSQGFSDICQSLAKTVLTSDNIEKHREIVVDNCLMELAPVYLDRANLDPHKEFSLRKEYVIKHRSNTELRDVICKCQFENLTKADLEGMRSLHCITESDLLDLYEKALGDCEARLAQEHQRAEEASEYRNECKFFNREPVGSALFIVLCLCFA